MMTNDEIREDLTQAKGIFRDYHTSAVPTGLLDALCEHIETLLARQAEVMEWADNNIPVSRYKREIRAILYPQPAAAGELLIPAPVPGSIESKMLIANRLLRAERDEWKRRCEAKSRLESAGYTEDEQGRTFDLNAVKCPYCGDSTPLTEEGGYPEEIIRNFDWPNGNAECLNCDKTFYYEIEACAITDSMTMEYDGTFIADGRDNG